MRELKVCFVGIGSIAKRHIKNLYEICKEKEIKLTIDALRRKDSLACDEIKLYIHEVFRDVHNLPQNYDVIFLTNPTEYHLNALEQLHDHANHFFIEKPLTSIRKVEDIFRIDYRENSIYYVACPLRYTGVIQHIKNHVNINDVISVRCISSSYLPDWRPGIDYRDTYSADKNLGGGVSIDLIHEWDYLKYLFGMPEKVFFTCGKKSDLELDCEDYAVYVAEYPDKVVELHLDYFGRYTIREIMILTNEDTIIGDLVHSRVSYLKENKVISFDEERNDYQKKEIEHFLNMIQRRERCNNGIIDAYHTLKLTQGEVGYK